MSVRVTNGAGRTVRMALGRVTVMAEVRVTPQPANRWLQIDYGYAEQAPVFIDNGDVDEQDGPIGSALMSLDGDREPIRHDRKLDLQGGTYEVVATVFTDEARTRACGRAVTTITVR